MPVKKSEKSKSKEIILQKILRLIASRPRSEKEIRDYLARRKNTSWAIEEILSYLKSIDLINDPAFADWWVEQRSAFRPKGKAVLKMELRQKGISEESIASAIENQDEEVLAFKAAEKKVEAYKHLPYFEFKKKIASFLQRRGFSWEIIKSVLAKVASKE